MSKDVDRAFLSSITYGLSWGDIDCICAVISVFLIRRRYYCDININVISRDNESGHATIESYDYDEDFKFQKRAITVWHCKGYYYVCRGICDSERPNEEETVEFSPYIRPEYYYPELLDFLDSVFPERADADMKYDYSSKLFLGRIEVSSGGKREKSIMLAKGLNNAGYAINGYEILKNQDDVELDPIRFYPRNLTKEIYKLEKANNGQVICRICHKPIETFSDCSADHIVPYSKGGKTTLSNMQLAHKSCNSKKKG